MNNVAKVFEALKTQVGCQNGLGVNALAKRCEISARDVRHAVTALREEGIGVCAHPNTGYFIAANDDELDKYCIAFLEHRALHSLKLASRLKKVALPEYMGQLKLKT